MVHENYNHTYHIKKECMSSSGLRHLRQAIHATNASLEPLDLFPITLWLEANIRKQHREIQGLETTLNIIQMIKYLIDNDMLGEEEDELDCEPLCFLQTSFILHDSEDDEDEEMFREEMLSFKKD